MDGTALQRAYYRRTACEYTAQHETNNPSCEASLDVLSTLCPVWGVGSVLDVGAGAGRVLASLRNRLPTARLGGIEPVQELRRQAELRGIQPGIIQNGSGEKLPFHDGSWDMVTAFGVLHHVAKPSLVVAEMLRVAKKAVVISDGNRFGQGRPAARLVKLAIASAGLWPAYTWLRTRGRGWHYSEGDGVYWSYSVYDSMRLLRAHSSKLLMLESEPTPGDVGRWSTSLLNCSAMLVVALK